MPVTRETAIGFEEVNQRFNGLSTLTFKGQAAQDFNSARGTIAVLGTGFFNEMSRKTEPAQVPSADWNSAKATVDRLWSQYSHLIERR